MTVEYNIIGQDGNKAVKVNEEEFFDSIFDDFDFEELKGAVKNFRKIANNKKKENSILKEQLNYRVELYNELFNLVELGLQGASFEAMEEHKAKHKNHKFSWEID